jgi:hypothetical protein
VVVLFATVCIYFQTNYKISNNYVEHHHDELSYGLRALVLYAVPFVGTLVLYSAFYHRWDMWMNRSFVFLIFFTICIYVLRCGISSHTDLIKTYVNPENQRYWIRISNQLVHGLVLFIFPFFYWKYADKETGGLYGFKYKGVLLKPYFIILLCLVPIVAIASTQKDFLSAYPMFVNAVKGTTGNILLNGSLFEACYGFDFLMNEFFFRGFVIIAFAKYLGRGIILPITMFYVFIHFGKPLGETVSSFFGGLALGLIAYETRSIYGGVIIHLGIAWLMEVGAGLGRLFFM